MPKRGRPSQDCMRKAKKFFREVETLYFYHQFRAQGEKHSGAVFETVQRLKLKYRICDTTVKHILSGWQPKGAAWALTVSERESDQVTFVPRIGNTRPVLSVGVGPRPWYRRINAKTD